MNSTAAGRIDRHDLLDVHEVSDMLGVPVRTLYSWRTTGYGPPGIRLGRHLRYRAADVEAWLDALALEQGAVR